MKSGQRLLILLGILLPVPLSAATGLTIPLPATVERLAARLVPFADAAPSSRAQPFVAGARGRIVETEDEVILSNLLSADLPAEKANAIHLQPARPESRRGRVKKARKTPAGRTHPTHAKREPRAPKPESWTPKPLKPPKPPPPPKSKASPAGDAAKVR